jgi:hypothetical protein
MDLSWIRNEMSRASAHDSGTRGGRVATGKTCAARYAAGRQNSSNCVLRRLGQNASSMMRITA